MGRSFSFSPFHQQQPVAGFRGSAAHLGNTEDQQALGKSASDATLPQDTGSVHYGHPGSETIERYKKHAQERAAAQASGSDAGGEQAQASDAQPPAEDFPTAAPAKGGRFAFLKSIPTPSLAWASKVSLPKVNLSWMPKPNVEWVENTVVRAATNAAAIMFFTGALTWAALKQGQAAR
jgi:hypothetical protein